MDFFAKMFKMFYQKFLIFRILPNNKQINSKMIMNNGIFICMELLNFLNRVYQYLIFEIRIVLKIINISVITPFIIKIIGHLI